MSILLFKTSFAILGLNAPASPDLALSLENDQEIADKIHESSDEFTDDPQEFAKPADYFRAPSDPASLESLTKQFELSKQEIQKTKDLHAEFTLTKTDLKDIAKHEDAAALTCLDIAEWYVQNGKLLKAREWKEEAIYYQRQAIASWEEAIKLDKNKTFKPAVYFYLAEIWKEVADLELNLGRPHKAAEAYRNALSDYAYCSEQQEPKVLGCIDMVEQERDPDDDPASEVCSSEINLLTTVIEEAKFCVRELIRLDPDRQRDYQTTLRIILNRKHSSKTAS